MEQLHTVHTTEFKDFVRNGVSQKYYIGTGNPNAKILLIGKESAIPKDNVQAKEWYSKNANDWHAHIEQNTCEILNYPVHEYHELRKGWGKNTWSKYQKLSDIIYQKESKPFHVDFLENIFTTEINDAPEKYTALADKSGLNERKQLFKNTKFIQEFPVIVLACSNYIKNNDSIREIDTIFDVQYSEGKKYTSSNWYYSHYNKQRTKLVIHTRQLSANVKPELLEDMGKIIRNHLDALRYLN